MGRLIPEKGFHDLLSAFVRSAFQGKLLIFGGANHTGYLDKLLKKRNDRIVFTGSVRNTTVRVLLTHASLFVLGFLQRGAANCRPRSD